MYFVYKQNNGDTILKSQAAATTKMTLKMHMHVGEVLF